MATNNILEWANESSLSNYPFNSPFELEDCISAASFIQFDNFIPELKGMFIDIDNIVLDILFDFGRHSSIVFTKQKYLLGDAHRSVRIYTPNNNRYLGCIKFGLGLNTAWRQNVGRKIECSLPFISGLVKSIPSNSGVYTLDNVYGDVELNRTAQDSTIFYNLSTSKKTVTFNAVTNHEVPPGSYGGLKKINLVSPVNNNINLAANDVIKITTLNASSLTIELVAGASSSEFSLPTLFQ